VTLESKEIQLPDDGLTTETCRSSFSVSMCKFYISALVGIIIEWAYQCCCGYYGYKYFPETFCSADIFWLHILHSLHYNSLITIQTNDCTQFYLNNDITTHKLLHVSGFICPSSGSTQLYTAVVQHFLHITELPKTPWCNVYAVDWVANWRQLSERLVILGFHGNEINVQQQFCIIMSPLTVGR